MFCTKCGSQLADDAAFYTKCGTRAAGAESPVQQEAVTTASPATSVKSNPATLQPSDTSTPAVDVDRIKRKSSKKLIINLAAIVGVTIIAITIFALEGSASPSGNNSGSNSSDSGLTYFVASEKSISEEYQPAVTLYQDGRFSFCANMGEGMGFFNGTYSVKGNIYTFSVTEAEFYGNKSDHESKFTMRRSSDILIYESKNSLGLTSKGSVFSLSAMPPKSIETARNLESYDEEEDYDIEDTYTASTPPPASLIDSGLTYFVGSDKSIDDEYQPAVILYKDGRFIFYVNAVNIGKDLRGFYYGTYAAKGDIYTFNVTEAEDYRISGKNSYQKKFIMRRDNDTLTYGSEGSIGLTSKGSVFSLSATPPKSIAVTQKLQESYKGDTYAASALPPAPTGKNLRKPEGIYADVLRLSIYHFEGDQVAVYGMGIPLGTWKVKVEGNLLYMTAMQSQNRNTVDSFSWDGDVLVLELKSHENKKLRLYKQSDASVLLDLNKIIR